MGRRWPSSHWRGSARGGLPARKTLPAVSLIVDQRHFILSFSAFFIYYFFNALAPEISPDGSGYHLGNVVRMWRSHGFDWKYPACTPICPRGRDAVPVGLQLRPPSGGGAGPFRLALRAAAADGVLGTAVRLCEGGYVRRAFWFLPVPVIGKDGVSAYNDLAVATLIYAVFYLLQVWDESPSI